MKYLLLTLSLLFTACSMKNYEHIQSKIIIIKSPQLKFADLGYIRNTDDSIELELFVAGRSVKKIAINYLICVDEGCMSRSSFNAEYLNANYPDTLLQNILLGRAIYDGEGKLKQNNGFTQKIKNNNVDIKYRVNSHEIFFKDRKNRIIFKIKDINQ
jgi:hypothetical protein